MGTTHLPLHLSSEVSISPLMVGGLHLLYQFILVFSYLPLIFYFFTSSEFSSFNYFHYFHIHIVTDELKKFYGQIWLFILLFQNFQLRFYNSCDVIDQNCQLTYFFCLVLIFLNLIFASIACRTAVSKASFISFLYFLIQAEQQAYCF